MTEIGGILIAVVLAVVAFIWGQVRGKQTSREDQFKRNADAHVKARKAQDEVGNLSGSGVTDRLRKRSGK